MLIKKLFFPMKRLPNKEEQPIEPTVQRIWDEIVDSMDQYTNDSQVSKFYLPEELLIHCHKAANIFTQLLYTPIPSPEEVKKTRLFGMLYLSMSCGVQIYLKERSLNKGYLPYKISNEEKYIRDARHKVGKTLSEGIKVQPPVSQVMELFITQLNTQQYIRRFSLKGREFNVEKFENLLPAAIMWGYLFAKELVIDTVNTSVVGQKSVF
ncbi:MAG TPA: hypothetical protein VG935_02585 [Patescibacteria group bacterium]|nr:hypothetical protein [Patescibacteria group bacterium]